MEKTRKVEAVTDLYGILRSLLFLLDPERAHNLVLGLMRMVGALPPIEAAMRAYYASPKSLVEVFGLTFPNQVGLAAGYDKDGRSWRGLACLGFGHIEVGTVTPLPQAGNPSPRIFRLPEDRALINRMGFPNRGAQYLSHQVRRRKPGGPMLGVNLGMNRGTPLESAHLDYLSLMRIFAPYADYLAINVSSPNTAGLRRLQARELLENLLAAVSGERRTLEERLSKRVPVLIKIAPDLSDSELDDILDVVAGMNMDGIIATNTTIQRPGIGSRLSSETGGLSGAPLRKLSTEIIEKIHRRTSGSLPIVASGGVMNASDAKEKLDAGAILVQIYTGLIYEGPGLVKRIVNDLER